MATRYLYISADIIDLIFVAFAGEERRPPGWYITLSLHCLPKAACVTQRTLSTADRSRLDNVIANEKLDVKTAAPAPCNEISLKERTTNVYK